MNKNIQISNIVTGVGLAIIGFGIAAIQQSGDVAPLVLGGVVAIGGAVYNSFTGK